jgi:hypothetical protein
VEDKSAADIHCVTQLNWLPFLHINPLINVISIGVQAKAPVISLIVYFFISSWTDPSYQDRGKREAYFSYLFLRTLPADQHSFRNQIVFAVKPSSVRLPVH